jgi:hypothetical protein
VEPVAAVTTAPDDLGAESPTRALGGNAGRLGAILAAVLSLYALYWVVGIVQPFVYRVTFLLVTLVLSFLFYPSGAEDRTRVTRMDWALIAVTCVALAWPIIDFENFIYRSADPNAIDVALGTITIVAVLEATRRTTALILPVTAGVFLAYAFYGPLLDLVGLGLLGHRGYDPQRIVGTSYMTLEGIFGVPLDVAATYIILFSLYGAVLTKSGRQVLSRLVDGCGRKVRGRRRPWSRRDRRRVAAWNHLRERRSEHRDTWLRRLAAPETRTVSAGHGRRHPLGRWNRRDHLPARAWRSGVHHRGVPSHHLPEGDRDGRHPRAAVLLFNLSDD